MCVHICIRHCEVKKIKEGLSSGERDSSRGQELRRAGERAGGWGREEPRRVEE